MHLAGHYVGQNCGLNEPLAGTSRAFWCYDGSRNTKLKKKIWSDSIL